MISTKKKLLLSVLCGLLTMFVLLPIQFRSPDLLLFNRIFEFSGFIQIVLASVYASFLYYKMHNRDKRGYWRRLSWLLFSFVFFIQLFLGIFADVLFLMSGKLHLPIPMLILAGPIFRGEPGFMLYLFLITVLLSGPAWCSQLCYFGAFDSLASSVKKKSNRDEKIINNPRIRYLFLFLVILFASIFRFLPAVSSIPLIASLLFGVVGIGIIILFSGKRSKMIHCSLYCPIGSLMTRLKYISGFRFKLNENCKQCGACIPVCKYNAIDLEGLKIRKLNNNCTYCGDCMSVCKHQALQYSFFGMKPATSETIWLFVTIMLHACFMTIARI